MAGTFPLVKRAFSVFSAERGTSRGAAIAFYTVTSIAPIVVIVIAVAGLVFGREAASGAIYQQFSGLLGSDGADFLQKTIAGASNTTGGITATIISVVTLILGASGVFLELEDSLNAMWQAKAKEGLAAMARARLASLGLVIALGFLLIVSLVIDAGLKGLTGLLPLGAPLMLVLSIAISVTLLAVLFAAIFKFLPATPVAWRDVIFGAIATAVLFEVGKFLIGMYLGSSAGTSSLGAAGTLLAMLFWVYYSSQIFLFGAALTKARAEAAGRSAPDQNALPSQTPAAASRPEKGESLPALVLLLLARVAAVWVVGKLEEKPAGKNPRRAMTARRRI